MRDERFNEIPSARKALLIRFAVSRRSNQDDALDGPARVSRRPDTSPVAIRQSAPRVVIAAESCAANSSRSSGATSSHAPASASTAASAAAVSSHSTVSRRSAGCGRASLLFELRLPILRPATCNTTWPRASTMSRSASTRGAVGREQSVPGSTGRRAPARTGAAGSH